MDVVKAPDPRLKIQTKPVKKITPALLNTLKNMIKLTQTFKDPEGVGLASTQIGNDEAYFVGRLHNNQKLPKSGSKRWEGYAKDFSSFINPKILSYSKKTKKYFEGCLSIPSIWGEVKRSISIKASYQDTYGKQIIKTVTGIPAWIFQHEVDHLNGILFSERVLEQKGQFYKYTGKDKLGSDIYETITI